MKIFDFCKQEAEMLKDGDTFTPLQHLLIVRFMEDACKKVREVTIEECKKKVKRKYDKEERQFIVDCDSFPTDLNNIEL